MLLIPVTELLPIHINNAVITNELLHNQYMRHVCQYSLHLPWSLSLVLQLETKVIGEILSKMFTQEVLGGSYLQIYYSE